MGYSVSGTTIKMTKGDTAFFYMTPYVKEPDGTRTPYTPNPGDSIRFALKKYMRDISGIDREPLLCHRAIPTDTFLLELNPDDTARLDYGKYYYDVQLTDAAGHVDTYISGLLELELEVD